MAVAQRFIELAKLANPSFHRLSARFLDGLWRGARMYVKPTRSKTHN
jgi:hypothetical protein